MAILLRHVNEPIAPVKSIDPNVDQGISDWIESMLVKDPTKRTQSAADAWDEFEEIIIGLLGPRWRRSARLTEETGQADTPNPLTPAPFQGTTAGAAASDEFQSFAWGQPAAETGGAAAAPAPYTPPPQDLPSGPMEETPAPEAPPAPAPAEASAAAPEAPPAPEPAAPSEEPVADSGFVTFGAPAPAPPTDALVPPPAEAPPAPPEPEVVPEPEPEVAATPEPRAGARARAAGRGGRGARAGLRLRDLHRPAAAAPAHRGAGHRRAAGHHPGARAAGPGARAGRRGARAARVGRPAASASAAHPGARRRGARAPGARAGHGAPEPEPAAAAAYEYDPNATVMPEALRRKPEPEAKPKKERKPKERKPKAAKPPKAAAPPKAKPEPKPKPVREGEKTGSKAFPIAIAAGAVIAIILGFLVGGSGGGGEEPAADTAALTGSAASSGAAVKVPADWSELSAAPDVPGLSLSDPKAAAPGGKDGGLAVVVGTVKKAADNSTLLAQPFLQAVGDVPKPSGAVQIGGGDVQALPLQRAQAQRLRPRRDGLRRPDDRRRGDDRVPGPRGRRRLVRLDLRPDGQHARAQLGRPAARRPERGLRGRGQQDARRAQQGRQVGPGEAQVGEDAAAAGGGGARRWPRRSTAPARRSPART